MAISFAFFNAQLNCPTVEPLNFFLIPRQHQCHVLHHLETETSLVHSILYQLCALLTLEVHWLLLSIIAYNDQKLRTCFFSVAIQFGLYSLHEIR